MSYSTLTLGRKTINDASLVLYLDAANTRSYPRSGDTWFDLSLYQNNGTLYNSPTFVPNANGGFTFNGIDNYIATSTPANLTPTTPLTLSTWVNTSSVLTAAQLVGSFNYSNLSGVTILLTSSTSLEFFIYNNLEVIFISSNFSIITTPVVNLVITYDGSNDANGIKVYVNDNELPTTIGSNIPVTTFLYNEPWRIGALLDEFGNPVLPITATVHLLQVYTRVLSSLELTQNYNAFKGRFGIF